MTRPAKGRPTCDGAGWAAFVVRAECGQRPPSDAHGLTESTAHRDHAAHPQWFFHCGDGAAFMGAVGAAELVAFPDAREELRSEADAWGWSAEAVESYLGALDKDSQPTGYLFMCRTCGRYMAYADST
ncbi:CbrC family protein [Streptomyces sp. RK31]|uniref:CbrC family protein n=1 Tax=Streptomyces sp. RK31 TaxID=2824892 RepID=UPI0027DD000D|nr:CbrC family protein [Streptomyces sp. RK31]